MVKKELFLSKRKTSEKEKSGDVEKYLFIGFIIVLLSVIAVNFYSSESDTGITGEVVRVCGDGKCSAEEKPGKPYYCPRDCKTAPTKPTPVKNQGKSLDLSRKYCQDMDSWYQYKKIDGKKVKPLCGNCKMNLGEECEMPMFYNKGWCGSYNKKGEIICKYASCGNGIKESESNWGVEECDDGNTDYTDKCIRCKTARCGDGYVQVGVEECDDGNRDNYPCNEKCEKTCPEGYKKIGVPCSINSVTGAFVGVTGMQTAKCSECKQVCGTQKREACEGYADAECQATKSHVYGHKWSEVTEGYCWGPYKYNRWVYSVKDGIVELEIKERIDKQCYCKKELPPCKCTMDGKDGVCSLENYKFAGCYKKSSFIPTDYKHFSEGDEFCLSTSLELVGYEGEVYCYAEPKYAKP